MAKTFTPLVPDLVLLALSSLSGGGKLSLGRSASLNISWFLNEDPPHAWADSSRSSTHCSSPLGDNVMLLLRYLP